MKIRLLTYNCSALPLLTRLVGERLRRIAGDIRDLDPDIVCLQEIGLQAHARILGAGWPHAYYRKRRFGLVAGGLVLLAKRPYIRASFIPFREQGSWFGYSALARFSRKGFMVVDWEDPFLRLIHAHPIADYGAGTPTWTDYAALQERQMRQLVDYASSRPPENRGRDLPLVVAGDLNFTPDAPAYRGLVSRLSLTDLMMGNSASSMVREESFGAPFGIPKRTARIDYVLVSAGGGQLMPERAFFALDRTHRFDDGTRGTLSDHLGVMGMFSLAERIRPQ